MMLYVGVKGRSRIDDKRVELDFRAEMDERGLWHAGRMTDSVEQFWVCMTYDNALVAVINECDRLGVDVCRLTVDI